MSRLGRYIIGAGKITARYASGKLTLTTFDAEVPPFVSDVAFEQDPFVGGTLKFDLGGAFGSPVPGPIKIKTITTTFDITPPTPSSYCLVVTKGHPSGMPVAITGWPPEDASANGAKPVSQLQIDSAAGDTINILIDMPFSIRQPLGELTITSSITVTYDKEYVKLLSARIEGRSIVWEFVGIKIGTTNITVGIGNRNPPFFYIVRHDVVIMDLKN